MKRLLKFLAIGAGALVALLAIALLVLWLFVDLDKLVNAQIAKAKPQLEQKLGRKIEVGKVTTHVFPVLGGRIEGLAIAADPTHPEDDRPLLRAESVGFDVALLKALVSLGKTIVIKDLYVDGLKVSVVRAKGGRLSFQDILDRQAKEAPAPNAPKKPLSPEVLEYLHAVSVDELRLQDVEIRLADHDTASGKVAEDYVKKLNMKFNDLRLSDPIKVKVTAALFAEKENLSFETSVGPLPQDLEFDGLPPIGWAKVKITEVDLQKLAPYLGPAIPVKLQSALLSMSWDVGRVAKGKPIAVAGELKIGNMQVQGGQKFDVRLDVKGKADLEGPGVDLERLELKVGAMELVATGALHDLDKSPRFEKFTLRSSTLDPALLLAYYPEAASELPAGLKLSGPIVVEVKASGDAVKQTITASADLNAVEILYPGKLSKPKGTACGLKVDGDFTSSDATLRSLSLILDELDLVVKGTVKGFKKPEVDLELAAKPFSFDRIARLVPAAGEQLKQSNAKASGDGRLTGHVKGSEKDIDAVLELALTGVKLDVPGTRLDGDLRLDVKAKGDPEKDLKVSLQLDANQAVIVVKDTLDKSAQTPLRVDLEAERKGDHLDLKKLGVVFAELKLDASGTFDLANGVTHVAVSMARLDLEKFAKIVTAIPADKAKAGFVDAKISVTGNPNKLETMAIELNPLNARLGRSDLRGVLKVVNLKKPQLRVNLSSQLLDLDQLHGASKAADPKQPKQKAPEKDDPSLKDWQLSGQVDLKRVVVSQTELTDFRGELELVNGVLSLKDCTLHVFDGTVSARGTEAEIWKGRMPFKANLSIKGIDMNKALSAKTRYANTLYGKADLEVHATGDGFETEELEQKLLGTLTVALNDGRLAKASVTNAVLGDFTSLERIPGVSAGKAIKSLNADNSIKNLAARIEIHDGKLNFTQPVTMTVDGSRMQLGGAVGIGGKLFLQGDYFVAPAVVNSLTAGKCKSDGELRVPIAINGTIAGPEFRPDGKSVVASLVERCLKGEAGKVIGDAEKKAEKKVGDAAKKEAGKLLNGLFK